MNKKYAHFEEKTALEHLKEARRKGLLAFESVHGVEPSGAIVAATDAAKEVAIFLTALTILLAPVNFSLNRLLLILGIFALTLWIWKTCRSAAWGWSRLEKVHRLIRQEKWEIEHHREQEKEELLELYHTKGFKDKQLEEVVEVLMADDNRLLQIMLEEELGLSLSSFEHPLRQAVGACLGALVASLLCLGGLWIAETPGMIGASIFLLCITSWISAKELGNDKVKSIVWTLAISFLSLSLPYFLIKTFFSG